MHQMHWFCTTQSVHGTDSSPPSCMWPVGECKVWVWRKLKKNLARAMTGTEVLKQWDNIDMSSLETVLETEVRGENGVVKYCP